MIKKIINRIRKCPNKHHMRSSLWRWGGGTGGRHTPYGESERGTGNNYMTPDGVLKIIKPTRMKFT
jgi:hypothetical protein